MDWFWPPAKDDVDDGFIRRPKVSARQRAIEAESLMFINERNKAEQGKFVQLAVIDRTLKDTIFLMRQNVDTAMGRGQSVDVLVQKSEDLTESSKLFLVGILPWYKRYWFSIWGYLNCSWCHGSKEKRSRDHII